jgi:hypothetical protein
MKNKNLTVVMRLAALLLFLLPIFLLPRYAFCGVPSADFICETGVNFYNVGRYDDALMTFKKALIIDPANQTAKSYISNIFKHEIQVRLDKEESVLNQAQQTSEVPVSRQEAPAILVEEDYPSGINEYPPQALTKEEAMNKELAKLTKNKTEAEKPSQLEIAGVKISGQAQLSVGITPDDTIWKRANFDLNEKYKGWRLSSDAAFNHQFNTYDPAVYDSFSMNLDTKNKQGFNFHTNFTVDPWSFVGKSDKITVTGLNGDTAELQMYYWSNTGYVVNNTVFTSLRGDTLPIPEIKVKDGKTDPLSVISYRNATTFNIPSMSIGREFQPMRELWLDFTSDQLKFRAFPIGYQNQAYSSDDPLGITNHGIWWKDSKWLRQYTPGNFNSGDTTPSFTKGRWDDSLSFLSKDSTGSYLTALRGFAFSLQPQENILFDTTIATPKHLWQDYGQVDNIISASRVKFSPQANLSIGGTFTTRTGFLTESKQKTDSRNYVGGMDLGYEITNGLKAQAEALSSKSFYDESNSVFETESRGNAYYFSLVARYPLESIMDLKYGYDQIAMKEDENFLLKGKFYAARMDRGFDSALSTFHDTRQDVFWSRHLHFRQSSDYYTSGLGYISNWDELNASRIGDGIDAGRNAMGFRFETLFENKFSNLFDVRNVHNTQGKFVENVVHDEATLKVTDKLTAKALGIYHRLPKTIAGVDPFEFDGTTGEFITNAAVPDGQDPTVKTGSIGLNYDFFDWLGLNGIYERTNDYNLAYGDFPRDALLNNTTLYGSFYQNDNLYRNILPFLYDQGVFPQAPYSFYNVFKTGLKLTPLKNMQIYLDYTRNEFEAASLNSDGMNHVGLEVTYMPVPKIGMHFKYIYSRSQDLDRLRTGITNMVSHNNFFSEFRYMPSKDDEFIAQYGVGEASMLGNTVFDPYGGSMLTLDTQHIIRMYYRRKF